MPLDLSPLDDRVELKGLLGAGGMGEVHRAWDRRLERPVAVKFVRGTDPRGAERLLLEARLQARVEHPHVVKVHEVGTLLERPCIVFQLVEGRPLSDVAAQLPVSAKVELLRQTAAGLHAAHLQGLVHRDVKPGNVLVEEGPGGARSAFLTDFGLARAEDAALSRTGLAPGTLDYMSPEQLVGPGPVDYRADVYSLGATLYALLAGRPPFRGADPSEEEERQVLRRIVEEDPLPLSKVSPQAPRDLDQIAARAMEKDPAARYPSAEAFAQDLDRFQRGEPILARRPGLARRVARWTQRNRALARALAVAAAALVVALGWTLWSARRSGLLALEAARLGAQAESMEDQQRMERLSPAHDLRPAKGKLRAEVEALRTQAGRGGPASFALGKGLELLGDVEGARAAYERAWSAGFRTPRVAEGLGTVLALLYRQKYERARETLEPAAREERLAALRAELREPAKQYLARGDAAGWRGALLRASIAMLEGDYAAARARAEEALALDPGRYEARGLIAESWLEESRQLAAEQHLEEADAAVTRAAAPLEEALRWGRSDMSLVKNRAQIHRYRADLAARRGQSPDQELGAMLSALDQARALDPDDPSLLVLRGIALVQKVQYSFLAGAADVLPLLDQAAAAYRQAMAIDPRDQKTLCLLGMCLYYRAFRLNETGRDALPTASEGLAALQRAAALAPKDPEVHAVSFLLRFVEATALEMAGRPSADSWRQSITEAEEALRLKTHRKQLRPILGQVWIKLARQDWEQGKDPRQELEQGLLILEDGYRSFPGQPAIAGQLASGIADAADVLMAEGEDARPPLERAVTVVEEVLARHPEMIAFQALKGEMLALEGQRRELAGEDPGPALAEAQRWLDRAAPSAGDDVSLQEAQGRVPLIEARWSASRGRDPGGMLGRAESRLIPFAARHQESVAARSLLASCALERATWSQRNGMPPEKAARAGLDQVAGALEKEPRDPRLWVLRAHLEALAGDREQARQSLEHAWATNVRVKASRESKRAEAEILH